MSRATRPVMHCTVEVRFALAKSIVGSTGRPVVGLSVERVARRLGCRPSQLRRCLLGRPVSVRATGRILTAAGVADAVVSDADPAAPAEPPRRGRAHGG